MPVPLVVFIHNLIQRGSYVPNNFLSRFQLNRIDTDNYGAIIHLDKNQIKMISGIYIFCRILVMNVLMNVKTNRDPNEGKLNETVELNFKVIGSILYHMFMGYLTPLVENYARVPDEPGNDIYSTRVFPLKDYDILFKSKDQAVQKFVKDMEKYIHDWLNRLYLLVFNAEIVKQKQEGAV
jgi:hypothetical protein